MLTICFNIGLNLILLLISHYFKLRIIWNNTNLDGESITPSDFAVLVTNLPPSKDENEVKQFFKKALEGIQVENVNYTYHIDEIVKLGTKKLKIQKQIQYLEEYFKKHAREARYMEDLHPPPKRVCLCLKKRYPTMDELQDQFQKNEDQI